MELMVVVGIISVAAAIAVPSWFAMMPSYRLRTAARETASTFQLARLLAATKSSEYRVVINKTKTPWSIHLEKGNKPLN